MEWGAGEPSAMSPPQALIDLGYRDTMARREGVAFLDSMKFPCKSFILSDYVV
jgi:hypothetical protein